MCTFASSRWPTMPIASRMLSCASRKNSCGSTCSTSRSSGNCTPRAASIARRTSSRCTSRGREPTVIPPRLFTPRTCVPATPISADSTGTPTIVSASSTARRIELTARSRFTIWPLRQPFDSAAPSAANLTPLASSSNSPIKRARLRAADVQRHNVPFLLRQICCSVLPLPSRGLRIQLADTRMLSPRCFLQVFRRCMMRRARTRM